MSDLTPARRCLAPTVVILALLAITVAGLLVATLMRLNSDDASIDASPTDAVSAAPPAEVERPRRAARYGRTLRARHRRGGATSHRK
ncbi:hypothetical protein [Rhodococcus oxybenzonivorans]|uniref:hypothetical protein n=1 Tax=Rhodococcus oxybenzonivorans TaxID=1990687 RepID=UPI0013A59B6E|nr:hypothetical protein [Rhodococcus oxybenzonivorans]